MLCINIVRRCDTIARWVVSKVQHERLKNISKAYIARKTFSRTCIYAGLGIITLSAVMLIAKR